MKNLFLIGALGSALAVASCSPTKIAQNKKNKTDFAKLKGNWQITSVDYDHNYRVKPFDEGIDAQCFVGSQWKLVPNNYSGTYALLGGGRCPSFSRVIKFELVDGAEFKFKKIVEGTKAKDNIAGYSLYLLDQTDTSFSLEQNVSGVRIVYNFKKTN